MWGGDFIEIVNPLKLNQSSNMEKKEAETYFETVSAIAEISPKCFRTVVRSYIRTSGW